ncbi:MAG TPA: hypothetical protein VHM25_17295 [Polyangiaceae bacterium]|jgi:hypothetical protein|nr:hypothetical protein [Polyangiaceae bacterium]
MIKHVRPNTKLRSSSAPPGPAPLDSNWDDDEKTVPGLDLDDPMNEFDRVTAIPDLPSEQYVKIAMAAAEDSRVPLPDTAPPEPPPPALPSAPVHALGPDEYFSLESDPPPSPRSPDSTARYAPVLPHNAPTARPAPPPRPVRSPGVPPKSPTPSGLELADLDQLDSLPAPPRRHQSLELSLDGPPPAAAFQEVASTASAIADMKDRYAMGDFSGALVIAEGILETSPDDPEAPRYAQSCRDVLTQMYSARLGSLDQRVAVAVPSDQIRWLTLDHRAGFLLSLVDGGITVDQILDISGMPRLDALRIMYQLLDQRVISLGG